jgi:hypothetical protein
MGTGLALPKLEELNNATVETKNAKMKAVSGAFLFIGINHVIETLCLKGCL